MSMLMKAVQENGIRKDILADLLADKRSENTKRAYQKDLSDFFRTMIKADTTQELIIQFLQLPRFEAISIVLKYKASMLERQLAEATINRRLASVRSIVKYAKRVGLCEWDLSEIEGEKIQSYRDTSGVTVKQMIEILNVPDRQTVKGKRDYAMLRLFWELALRRSEVTKLNIEDFDPEFCAIKILGKGKGTQKISMNLSDRTKDAVMEWLGTRPDIKLGDPLFTTFDRSMDNERRLTSDGIYKIISTISKDSGITKQMSPHRLRHSAITAALEATQGDVRRVQKLSRHSKIETVLIYDDNRVNQQKQVTDLLAGLA